MDLRLASKFPVKTELMLVSFFFLNLKSLKRSLLNPENRQPLGPEEYIFHSKKKEKGKKKVLRYITLSTYAYKMS